MQYAAAYIRVSTDDQTEYSPDAQLRAIKAYCEKNNVFLDPSYIFADEGYSGRKAEKRPAFMRMIGAAKKKPVPFQVILVHKFDRFARSREDSIVYKSLLRKECGIQVISITESIENDKMSIIMESMLEAMAEYYSINLSEEVKKGMVEKARRGEPCSIAPFGYKMENKQLVPHPNEAEAVKKIYTDFIRGKAYLEIAKECNAAGLRTHRGGLFENRTIDYIIHNPVYAGYIRWTPTKKVRRQFSDPESMVIKGQHVSLISPDEFSEAQKRADQMKAIWKPYYKPASKEAHWLVGLLRDPHGHSMVNSNGYFVCSYYAKGKCPDRNSISVNVIEEKILNYVRFQLTSPSKIAFVRIQDEKNNEEINNTIADLEMRLSRTKAAYENGVDTLEEYSMNKTRLLTEIENAKRKKTPCSIDENLDQVIAGMKSFIAPDADRPLLSKEIFKEIVWDKSNQLIHIVYFVS